MVELVFHPASSMRSLSTSISAIRVLWRCLVWPGTLSRFVVQQAWTSRKGLVDKCAASKTASSARGLSTHSAHWEVSIFFYRNLPAGFYRELETSSEWMESNGRCAIEILIKTLNVDIIALWSVFRVCFNHFINLILCNKAWFYSLFLLHHR